MGEKVDKAMDAGLANSLWPVFVEHGGNLKKVLAYCQGKPKGHPERVSYPTLLKLKVNFGWDAALEKERKAQFTPGLRTGIDITADLDEAEDYKNGLREALKKSPLDMQLHSIYGAAIGRCMDVKKLLLAQSRVDPDRIIQTAIQTLAGFLMDRECGQAVEELNESLESLHEQIKGKLDGR